MILNHLRSSPTLTTHTSNIHLNVILLYFTNNPANPVDFVKFSLARVTVRDCNPTTNPITREAPSVGSLRQLFQ